MVEIYDILLCFDREKVLTEIRWRNEEMHKLYASYWKFYLRKTLDQIPDFHVEAKQQLWHWKSEAFAFMEETFGDELTLVFLKKEDPRLVFYEKTFDLLNESIQIYDKNADIIYFNEIAKKVAGIDGEIQGKNLLEVFALTGEESTSMSALRMNAPIRNRFTHYHTKTGKELVTVNTSLPIRHERQLIGVLNLEENLSVIQKKSEQLIQLKRAMEKKLTDVALQPSSSSYTFEDFIGQHPSMVRLRELAARVALQDSNILMIGETGTGKEILAHSIHNASTRQQKNFVALNCAAVPENLIESILFGTQKGSFTGSTDKPGLLETADLGTLFLDELNSMSLGMQAKILRALQEGTFRRVGGNREIHTNVRVISSCNEDPFLLMKEHKLRSDLFYRLATIVLEIPPLRERTSDIELLTWHHIRENASHYAFPFTQIDPSVLWQLQQYSWPGNIRELFHVIDYAMNVSQEQIFHSENLPGYLFRKEELPTASPSEKIDMPCTSGSLRDQLDAFEAELLQRTLSHYCGNVTKSAKALGLQRQGLQYRIRKYGITV